MLDKRSQELLYKIYKIYTTLIHSFPQFVCNWLFYLVLKHNDAHFYWGSLSLFVNFFVPVAILSFLYKRHALLDHFLFFPQQNLWFRYKYSK